MGLQDAWVETAFVAISLDGGSDLEAATLTESIDISGGEKDFESIKNMAGGRIIKWTPETDHEITLEAYPLEAGTDTGSTLKGFFDLLHTTDASQPLSITNTRTRTQVRLVVLWTDDTTVTSAVNGTASGKKAMRMTYINGYVTSVKPSFTDGVLKFTIKGKFPAFNKSGTGNITYESTDGTATLGAISSYTAS